jgi:hypothetical protein
MKKKLVCFFILFILNFTTVQAQESEAAKLIIAKIEKAETDLKEGKQLNQQDLNEIVCLTNIETKKGEGSYIGIIFYPSEREIQIWKDWFEKNKTKISYSTDNEIYIKEFGGKVIQVEYENGKFRNNVCDDDKKFQDWLRHNKKN